MNDPGPAHWDEFERQYLADQAVRLAKEAEEAAELGSNCNPAPPTTEELASNCQIAPTPARTRPCPGAVRPYPHEIDPKTDANGQHCCGKDAPWQSGGTQ
jgi:type II secretory pathway pseudopilin PulG